MTFPADGGASQAKTMFRLGPPIRTAKLLSPSKSPYELGLVDDTVDEMVDEGALVAVPLR